MISPDSVERGRRGEDRERDGGKVRIWEGVTGTVIVKLWLCHCPPFPSSAPADTVNGYTGLRPEHDCGNKREDASLMFMKCT